jgi:hypothetical protein
VLWRRAATSTRAILIEAAAPPLAPDYNAGTTIPAPADATVGNKAPAE